MRCSTCLQGNEERREKKGDLYEEETRIEGMNERRTEQTEEGMEGY